MSHYRLKPPPPLTQREWEVALLVREGLGNKQIAVKLGVAVPTVKTHIHRAFEKLGFTARFSLARWTEREVEKAPDPQEEAVRLLVETLAREVRTARVTGAQIANSVRFLAGLQGVVEQQEAEESAG